MADEFAIGTLEPRCLDAFLDLLADYLGPVAAVRYRWLYLGNPHGTARTYVARHRPSGRLVGCTSLFPRRIAVGDHVVLAALGGDAYVLPEMRRRGVARRLHEETRAALGGELAFMFGPPAPDNLRVLKRVGAREVRTLRHFTCPLRGAWVGSWLRQRWAGHRLLGRLVHTVPPAVLESAFDCLERAAALRFVAHRGRPLLPVERVDDRWDDLWERARPRGATAPVRDSAYLQWRFLDQPGQGVRMLALPSPAGSRQLSGYAVIGTSQGRLTIHDLLCETWEDVVVLAEGLRQIARDQNLAAATLRLDQRGPYVAALLWAGFLPTPNPVPFQILAPPGNLVAAQAEALPWLFTLGDEDWSGAALEA